MKQQQCVKLHVDIVITNEPTYIMTLILFKGLIKLFHCVNQDIVHPCQSLIKVKGMQ